MTGSATILLIALLLDAWLGEPDWLWNRFPHPAALMGRLVDAFDRRFNAGAHRRFKGVLAVLLLLVVALALGWTFDALSPFGVIEIIVVAVLLAQKSLVQHVGAVGDALQESITAGRRTVAMIVGRDVTEMNEPDVVRAAIESGAENFSDGVIAPAFWYLIGGLPGLLAYKVVNTADSMIGHRTPRHEAFGWAAARLDDVLNWIPARLSSAFILAAHGRVPRWRDLARDAGQHRSPNAGWPEAAMARCLDVALSGPRSYDGVRREFPFVNPDGDRFPGPDAIDACTSALWRSWAVWMLAVGMIALS